MINIVTDNLANKFITIKGKWIDRIINAAIFQIHMKAFLCLHIKKILFCKGIIFTLKIQENVYEKKYVSIRIVSINDDNYDTKLTEQRKKYDNSWSILMPFCYCLILLLLVIFNFTQQIFLADIFFKSQFPVSQRTLSSSQYLALLWL